MNQPKDQKGQGPLRKFLGKGLSSLLILLGGFSLLSYLEKDLGKWVLREIQNYSEQHLPFRIQAASFSLRILSPGFSISNVRLEIKNPSQVTHKDTYQTIHIQEIRGTLDLIPLMGGQVVLSSLLIEKPQAEVDLDSLSILSVPTPSSKSNSSSAYGLFGGFLNFQKQGSWPWEENGDGQEISQTLKKIPPILKKIPLYRLVVKGASARIYSSKKHWSGKIRDFSFLVINYRDRVSLQLENSMVVEVEGTHTLSPNLFSHLLSPKIQVPLEMQMDLRLSEADVDLSYLNMKVLDTTLEVNGHMEGLRKKSKNWKGQWVYKLQSDLGHLSNGKIFLEKGMEGNLGLQGEVLWEEGKKLAGPLEMRGSSMKIEKFTLGDWSIKGDWNPQEFSSSILEIHQDAIDLKLIENLKVTFSDPIKIQGHLNLENLDLNALLVALDVGDIPLELFADGKFDCQGQLTRGLQVHCSGNIHADQLEVRNEGNKPEDVIIWLKDFLAQGEVNFNDHEVNYKAKVQMGPYSGESSGVIDFDKGFKISYSTPKLNFKEISYLAGLRLEGESEISGSTEGDSHRATFFMDMKGRNFFFEDYGLGNLEGHILYQKGHLYFQNIKGSLGENPEDSSYRAQVDVDLLRMRLEADAQSDGFDVRRAQEAFRRIVSLPLEFSGRGTSRVHVEGPLRFNALTYDFQTQVKGGLVNKEPFSDLVAHFIAKDGEVQAKNVRIKRELGGSATLVGEGHPNGNVDFHVTSQGLRLEEFQFLTSISDSLTGALDLSMDIKGYVLHPEVSLNLKVKDTVLGDESYTDSEAELIFSPRGAEGKAQVLGRTLRLDFQLPWNESDPFYFSAQAHRLNLSPLLSFFWGGSRGEGLAKDYFSELTGDVELYAPQGGFFNSTGLCTLKNLSLRRGDLVLFNEKSVKIRAQRGLFSIDKTSKALWTGGDGSETYFEVIGTNFSRSQFDLQIRSQTNLRLMQIFLPFMEELTGRLRFSINLSGDFYKPNLSGGAEISNGYAKIRNFSNGFERLSARVEFSRHKVLIQDIQALLGGGKLTGSGQVELKEWGNFPTLVKGHLEKAELIVPDHVQTQGSADITFSGDWFPFKLSGLYRVTGGLVDMEFESDEKSDKKKEARGWTYLPKAVLKESQPPVELDIDVQLQLPLSVKNSTFDGKVSGGVRILGRPEAPQLRGRLEVLSPSSLLFRDKIFRVQDGNVTFKDTMGGLDPSLYILSRTRILEYDIDLLVQGTAKKPIFKMSSVPALSDVDIVSLITFGVTTNDLNPKGSSPDRSSDKRGEVALQNSVVDFLTGRLNKGLEYNFGVNLQISSRYDEVKNTVSQKVSFSKKLTDRIILSTSRTQGGQNSQDVQIKYLFDSRLSAVGFWEAREPTLSNGGSSDLTGGKKETETILGLDLQYRKEFR